MARRGLYGECGHYAGTVGLAMLILIVAGGDVIFVPERQSRVLVFGEVRSPGYYPVDSQTRLLDVIARAGRPNHQMRPMLPPRDVDGTAATEQII